MKAGIYLGKETVEIRELDLPEVEDDVLVQNVDSSICGTDVAVFAQGPNTRPQDHCGRRIWARNRLPCGQSRKNATEFVPGERVYPYPRNTKNDTRRAGTIGGFSEYIM